MKRRLFLSSLLVLLGAVALPAQETLTLQECRELAVANNAKVRVAGRKAEAAEEVRREAFTKYFPTVDATGMAFHTSSPVIDYDLFNLVNLQMIKKGITASVMAVQPVFAGGQIVNGNKLAGVGVEASRLEKERTIDDVLLTTDQYYWQIYTLKAKKQTLEQVIQLVDTVEYQVKVAVDAGVVLRNELLKVQLRQNDLKASMVDLDNGIALCSNLLAQHIGLNGQTIDIAGGEVPDEVPEYPLDAYMEPSQALPDLTNYKLLNQQVEAAELRRKLAVGANMPTVGVGAGYFYDDFIRQHNSFGAVFVAVNIPISGWWGGSHSIKKASLEADNARAELTDLSQMLEINMQNTWDDLTAAHRKMMIARESIDQSKENLRISTLEFRAGVSTVTNWLDAQTLYRQSLDQYSEAFGAYSLAYVRYLDATGRTPRP